MRQVFFCAIYIYHCLRISAYLSSVITAVLDDAIDAEVQLQSRALTRWASGRYRNGRFPLSSRIALLVLNELAPRHDMKARNQKPVVYRISPSLPSR